MDQYQIGKPYVGMDMSFDCFVKSHGIGEAERVRWKICCWIMLQQIEWQSAQNEKLELRKILDVTICLEFEVINGDGFEKENIQMTIMIQIIFWVELGCILQTHPTNEN